MTLKANKVPATGGAGYDPVETGTYPARLVSVVDMGLQEQRPYKGQEKPPKYEIRTTYELLDEYLPDDDGNDILDKPRWQSETLTLHNLDQDRAKSTIRMKALDPELEHDGDWEEVLNTPCMITIVHNKNMTSGKIYANIGNVSPMRAKQADKAKPLVNDPVMFTLDDPDISVFVKFHEKTQEKIMNNLEYEGSLLEERYEAWKESQDDNKDTETEGEDW